LLPIRRDLQGARSMSGRERKLVLHISVVQIHDEYGPFTRSWTSWSRMPSGILEAVRS
jgi:hypothetical protein